MIAKDILTPKFLEIKLEDTISQMIGKMRKAKAHFALVFEGKKYLGLVGKKFLLTSKIDPHAMKVANIVKKRSKSKTPFYVPILSPDTKLQEIARLMNTADVHALPVMQNDKVIGVVTAKDLAKAIAPEYKAVKAYELGSMKLKTAKESDEIGKLVELMHEKNIQHVPVVDKSGQLSGIVSTGNLIDEFLLWDAFKTQKIPGNAKHEPGKKKGYGTKDKIHLLRVPVEQIMTTAVCVASPDDTVTKAVQKMESAGVTTAVLARNNVPFGILTLKDLFKDYAKSA